MSTLKEMDKCKKCNGYFDVTGDEFEQHLEECIGDKIETFDIDAIIKEAVEWEE